MARQRTLDPGFFRNEELAELPFEARLLFAGLWTAADREGRLEDRPRRIKVDLFPYDRVDVETALTGLADLSMIRRYRVKGVPLIVIRNFQKFQHCHPREKASVLPGPELADPEEVRPGPTLGKPLRGQAVLSKAKPSKPSYTSGSSKPSDTSACALPAVGAVEITAADFVAEFSDKSAAVGIKPIPSDCGRVGKASKELLAARKAPELISAAIGRMVDRNRPPNSLPYLVAEIERERAGHAVNGSKPTKGQDAMARINAQGEAAWRLMQQERAGGLISDGR
jgi:hypothetical protein